MAKSKHSPALYELIAKQGARGKSPLDRPQTAAPTATPPAPIPDPVPEPVVEAPPQAVEPPPPEPVVAVEPPKPISRPTEPESVSTKPLVRFWQDPVKLTGIVALVGVIAIGANFIRTQSWPWGRRPRRPSPGPSPT